MSLHAQYGKKTHAFQFPTFLSNMLLPSKDIPFSKQDDYH